MRRRLFVDLDGVLGDFYGFYFTKFGVQITKDEESKEFWDNIRNYGTFYRDQPLMPDAKELWEGVHKYDISPTILTGLPRAIRGVEMHKRMWVNKHFGRNASMIACASVDKKLYGNPGDILIDDRVKYRSLWTAMGGIYILHTSAKDSLRQLEEVWNL